MRNMLGAACGVFLTCAQGVWAQNVVVVELFTSQGCISCPPADVYFAELAHDPRLLPLALHVDYWDYIGWADHFADPRFTERQKSYARSVRARSIYTPQFVVGGVEQIEGFDRKATASAIARHAALVPPVELGLTREGDLLQISGRAPRRFAQAVNVDLVHFVAQEEVSIERGENAGKVMRYHNIVTDWRTLREWDGAEALALSVPVTGGGEWAVILQAPGPGPILSAARLGQ